MEVSTAHQIYVFSFFIALGMVCGAVFDMQRFLRKISFAGDVRTTIEDTLFIAFFVCTTIMVSLRINNGEVRYYEVMGAVSGVLFYAAVLSRPFLKILSFFAKMAEKILVKPIIAILRFLSRPARAFILKFKRFISRIKRKIRIIGKSVKKRKKLIKKRVKML